MAIAATIVGKRNYGGTVVGTRGMGNISRATKFSLVSGKGRTSRLPYFQLVGGKGSI